MQNWERLYSYIHEYQRLLYEYYPRHAVAFLTTYWNLNVDDTIWDTEQLLGGYYERIGELSGVLWNKYLLLPVYFVEEITTGFDGSEIGQTKEQETTIVIPSDYGITPYPNDIVKLEQEFLRPVNDVYPVFVVSGVEIHPNTDKRFWKLKLKVVSDSTTKVEEQTQDTLVFFDYDKKIHEISEATTLARMLSKNEDLKDRLSEMWDENSGFYQV